MARFSRATLRTIARNVEAATLDAEIRGDAYTFLNWAEHDAHRAARYRGDLTHTIAHPCGEAVTFGPLQQWTFAD